jgi:hypothetical protein
LDLIQKFMQQTIIGLPDGSAVTAGQIVPIIQIDASSPLPVAIVRQDDVNVAS